MTTGRRRSPVRRAVTLGRAAAALTVVVALVVLTSATAVPAAPPTTGPAGTAPGTTRTDGTTPAPSDPAWPRPPVPGTPTARDVAEQSCLDPLRPVEVLARDHTTPWPARDLLLVDGTTIDARSETFDNSELDAAGFGIGVKVHHEEERNDLCFVGGTITTDFDPEDTPWETWHQIYAVTVETPRFTVVGTSFFNQGDLISFISDAEDWQVIGVRADDRGGRSGAYGHDDCIENDLMHSGLVADSKFDGCNTFLSSTNSSVRDIDGGANEVVVRDSLVRLQPYRSSFNTGKYGEDAHGGFFKWAPDEGEVMVPPTLRVSNSVFRSDTPAVYGGNDNGFLGLPPDTVCEDVVLIGTEAWPEDELASWTDQCDDLVLGTTEDWDAAVARWDLTHPRLRDLPAQGRDMVAGAVAW